MGKRISSGSFKTLSLGLDQFLKKISENGLLVCGTGNMEGVPPNKNKNMKDCILLYSAATSLEKHHRKQT